MLYSSPSLKALVRYRLARLAVALAGVIWLVACSSGGGSSSSASNSSSSSSSSGAAAGFTSKEALGEALFHDVNLSANRTQSCATCHNPEHAFIDARVDASGQVSATSLGDDGLSRGDRNTPTAMYAAFTPAFNFTTHARFNSQQPDYEGYSGGQFMDGRQLDLAGQASEPPLNPLEMGMGDKAGVVERLRENSLYEVAFSKLFGRDIWASDERAYEAMTEALSAFELSENFSPFDSRYDRFLKGEYVYDPLSKAARGKALFFSQQFTNCATCHQLRPNSRRGESFTNFEYHNIGVPSNVADRVLYGQNDDHIDLGLASNPAVADETGLEGKFRVPTLRNVAVTAPYMHNGVFKQLKTVIQFYDHFLTGSTHTINPETGLPWQDPAIPETLSAAELKDGGALNGDDIEAMVCFLRTLTDAPYEHLIRDDGTDCGEP